MAFAVARLAYKRHRLFAHLSKPNVSKQWNRLGGLTPSEKREILHGSWRQTPTTALLPDPDDRDAGGALGVQDENAARVSSDVERLTDNVKAVPFQTDEDVEDFIDEESKRDAEEQRIPTLRLANEFFKDLAATADEEFDRDANDPPPLMSEEERREEEQSHHAAFFASYYQQQKVISASQEEASRLQDIFRRPLCHARLRVNTECPLSRLMVRHQIEKAVEQQYLARTADPLLFEMQTAEDMEKAAAVDSAQAGSAPTTLTGGDEAGLTAALLQEWISDTVPTTSETSSPALQEEAGPPFNLRDDTGNLRCATVGHLHWLQRQVASGSVILTDSLSHLIALLCLELLLLPSTPANSFVVSHDAAPLVQMDALGDEHVGIKEPLRRQFYMRDVAHRIAEERQLVSIAMNSADITDEEQQILATVESRLLRSCVVISLDSEVVATRRSRSEGSTAMPPPLIPPQDRTPNMMVVGRRNARKHSRNAGPTPSIHEAFPPGVVSHAAVVLCTPDTSRDGCRCRSFDDESEWTGLAQRRLSAFPSRDFVFRCRYAGERYTHLQRELRESLMSARDGGYVVYATQSMNPIENEAVVCSVISRHRRGRKSGDGMGGISGVTCVDASEWWQNHSTPSALTHDAQGRLTVLKMLWDGKASLGLSEWTAIEGGPEDQDPSWCDPAVVREVAQCSRRVSPLSAVDDAWFVVVLQVHRAREEETLTQECESDVAQAQKGREACQFMVNTVHGGKGDDRLTHSEVHFCSSSLERWWASFHTGLQQCGWEIISLGQHVGTCVLRQEQHEGKTKDEGWSPLHPSACRHVRFSSAISGSIFAYEMVQCLRSPLSEAPPPSGSIKDRYSGLPQLSTALWILSELLRTSRLSLSALHAALAALGNDANDAMRQEMAIFTNDITRIVEEQSMVLATSKDTAPTRRDSFLTFSVSLLPCLPSFLSEKYRLEDAVIADLDRLVVICTVESSGRDHVTLCLDVCAPERGSFGTEAEDHIIKEMSVRVRDSLQYLLRRLAADSRMSALLKFRLPDVEDKMIESVRQRSSDMRTSSALRHRPRRHRRGDKVFKMRTNTSNNNHSPFSYSMQAKDRSGDSQARDEGNSWRRDLQKSKYFKPL